jgi:hypothetical protein
VHVRPAEPADYNLSVFGNQVRLAAGSREKTLRFSQTLIGGIDYVSKRPLPLAHFFDQRSQLAPKMVECRVDFCEQNIE